MAVPSAFSSSSNEESNRRAWEATLDRLEQDVLMAERFLESGQPPTTEPWEVPQLDGPMPDGLLRRASEILLRQAEVKDSLRVALAANDKQRAFADRVNLSSSQGSARPAYVDFTA